MKLKIIARSDRGSFIGKTSEEGFSVITLDDSVSIELGDVLSKPDSWDDRDGLFMEVKNLTQDDTVNICIENWHMRFDKARELLERLGTPEKIYWLAPWPDCEPKSSIWGEKSSACDVSRAIRALAAWK